jgi:hypothetical protein
MVAILNEQGRGLGPADEFKIHMGAKEVDMKKLMVFALLGGLALTAPAQTAPENAVRIRAYQIELPATGYKLMPGDFDVYKGGYELANGAVLDLYQRGKRLYASVGEGEAHEVVAIAPNVFVARDRELKITLERGDFGDVRGELLMVVPGTSQANAGKLIRMVALR